jgi:hypothetical protein
MTQARPERQPCRREHLTITFDLRARAITVGCLVCYGTWPEPDAPPGLMDTALAGAKDLIGRKVIRDYSQGDW